MKVTYKMARELTAEDKLQPQAKQMVDIIVAAGKDGIEKTALVAELTKVVKTRQPVERIVAFYQQKLGPKGSGVLLIEKTAEAAPAPATKADAPVTATA